MKTSFDHNFSSSTRIRPRFCTHHAFHFLFLKEQKEASESANNEGFQCRMKIPRRAALESTENLLELSQKKKVRYADFLFFLVAH